MQMEWSYVGAVVISGLAIVFAARIILIFLVWIMGKIFDKLSAKKSGGNAKKAPAAESSKPAPVNTTAAPAADDESEVIAVIAAAVAAMSEEYGTPLRIHSIKRSAVSKRSNAWARAAAGESTRAF